MRTWSQQRLIATLAVVALAAMEPVSWLTADVPPCLVNPADYAASLAQRDQCPTLHAFLLAHANDVLDTLSDPQRATAFFAVILAVAMLLWWLSTRRLARAAVEAAHAARISADALTAAEQAQLFTMFDVGNIPQVLSELGRSEHGEAPRAPVERMYARFVCKNYGRSTALLKEISHDFQHLRTLPYRLKYSPIPDLPRERALVAGATSAPIDAALSTPLSAADATSIRAGDSSLWLYGRILYEDAFGREREHRFLCRYRIGYGFQPHPHEEYSRNT